MNQLSPLLHVCMLCNSTKRDGEDWENGPVFPHVRKAIPSHGLCDTCLDQAADELLSSQQPFQVP